MRLKNILASSLLIITSPLFAQQAAEAIEKTEVKLNVDLSSDRINPAYKGVPLKELIDQLEKKLSITKGEFESSSEFSKKIDIAAKSARIQSQSLNSQIVIKVDVQNGYLPYESIKYRYSADTNELSFLALARNKRLINAGLAAKSEVKLSDDVDIFDLIRVMNKTSNYIGSNAFGATLNIEKQESTRYGIISSHLNWLKFARSSVYVRDEPIAAKIPIAGNSAAKLLPKLSALLVFKPEAPYIAYDYERIKPTLDYPTDMVMKAKYLTGELLGIVFYSRADGSVIYRMPENFGMQN